MVQEVLSLCTEAAEEQIPLWYRVYLDGAVFHVDESQLVLVKSFNHIADVRRSKSPDLKSIYCNHAMGVLS